MGLSIIIPSAKIEHLRPCLESIQKYTSWNNTDIIVVANGMSQEGKEYLEKNYPLEFIWSDKMLGYPKAINMGIKVAPKDNDILLLNDDTILLPQGEDIWIDMLYDLKADIVGPLKLYENTVHQYYIQFFCALIKHEVIETIGLLDETFGYGNSEDLDYCIKAKLNGFKIGSIPVSFNTTTTMKIANYPIFHAAHETVKDIPDFEANAEKNIAIIKNRYRYLPPEPFEQERYING